MNQIKNRSPDGRYVRGEFIAKGAFKKVYQALDEEEGLEVAWNEASLDAVLDKEVSVLQKMRHPNVVSILETWDDKERKVRVFLTELLASGSLRSYVKRISQRKLTGKVIASWGRQILEGLVYLHTNNIIHRDLKCDNIFINGNKGEVKIGDFGLSCVVSMAAGSVIGTPEFMAPEIYDEHYTDKVDVYSFGMCLLEMATGTYPYAECENCGQVFKRVTRGSPPNSFRELPEGDLKTIIKKCLKPCADRPTAQELINLPFFHVPESEDDETNTARVNANTNAKQITNKPPVEIVRRSDSAELKGDTASDRQQCILEKSEAQNAAFAKALSAYNTLVESEEAVGANYPVEPDPLDKIDFGSQPVEKAESTNYSQKLSTLHANHVKILQKMHDIIAKNE